MVTFTIRELAEEFGVTKRTLRFYEEERLVKPARTGNRRIYLERDRARIRLVIYFRKCEIPISEIKKIIKLLESATRKDVFQEYLARTLEKSLQQRLNQRRKIQQQIDLLRQYVKEADTNKSTF